MYKDSSMKKKEKKKRFRCEVSELYELMLHVNHMTDLDIIFFWCDFCNIRVESLTLFSSFSDCSDHSQFDIIHDLISFTVWCHSQFDIVDRFDIMCNLISFTVWYHLQFDIVSEFDIICSLILSADLISCMICLNYSSRMLRKKSDSFDLLK